MQIDVMVGPTPWDEVATLAPDLEGAGFTGMTFTDTTQTPWMSIATAAQAAPTLNFTTGIAVAFPSSPMVMAGIAWELAGNTQGRFRLGLGSQIKAHIERRYGAAYDPPGPRLRSYLLAVRDILAAFRGEAKLDHHSDVPRPDAVAPDLAATQARPRRHQGGRLRRRAVDVQDGRRASPTGSTSTRCTRCTTSRRVCSPRCAPARRRSGHATDLLIPVFVVPGDTPEERAALTSKAKRQIGFYGSTPNYAFQFDELGFEGTTEQARGLLRNNDMEGLEALITDEMLTHYAVVGPWDDIADTLIDRYGDLAERVISYLTVDDVAANPENLGRWGEIARAVRDYQSSP